MNVSMSVLMINDVCVFVLVYVLKEPSPLSSCHYLLIGASLWVTMAALINRQSLSGLRGYILSLCHVFSHPDVWLCLLDQGRFPLILSHRDTKVFAVEL